VFIAIVWLTVETPVLVKLAIVGAVGCLTGLFASVLGAGLIVTSIVPELTVNGTVPVAEAYVQLNWIVIDCPIPSWLDPELGSFVTMVNLLFTEVIDSPSIQ